MTEQMIAHITEFMEMQHRFLMLKFQVRGEVVGKLGLIAFIIMCNLHHFGINLLRFEKSTRTNRNIKKCLQ